jgi:hypothetical protein
MPNGISSNLVINKKLCQFTLPCANATSDEEANHALVDLLKHLISRDRIAFTAASHVQARV